MHKRELGEGEQQSAKRSHIAMPNTQDNKEEDPYILIDAAREGQLAQVQYLITTKPDVYHEMMGLALIEGARSGHLPVVKFLIQNHADIETRTDTGLNETALLAAGRNNHNEVVGFLIESKADARARNSDSDTVFLLAAENGNLALMKFLLFKMLSNGIHINDIYVSGHEGSTALLNAAEYGHLAIVEWLFDKVWNGEFGDAKSDADYEGARFSCSFSVLEVDHYGRNAFLLAAEKNHLDIMEFLYTSCENTFKRLERCDNENHTALLLASSKGSIDAVNFLIQHGAKINHTDFEGNNAFHLAAQNGSSATLKILLSNLLNSTSSEIFSVLDTPNKQGLTARAIMMLPDRAQLLSDFPPMQSLLPLSSVSSSLFPTPLSSSSIYSLQLLSPLMLSPQTAASSSSSSSSSSTDLLYSSSSSSTYSSSFFGSSPLAHGQLPDLSQPPFLGPRN